MLNNICVTMKWLEKPRSLLEDKVLLYKYAVTVFVCTAAIGFVSFELSSHFLVFCKSVINRGIVTVV